MNRAKILAIVCLLATAYGVGGWRTANYYQAKQAKEQVQAQRMLASASQAAAQRERSLNQSLLTQSEQLMKVQTNADAQRKKFNAALHDGAVRLSIRTRSHPAAACANPAIASEPSAETRAELVPADAANLIDIAASGDAAVRQLNAVIDAYQGLKNACDIHHKGQNDRHQ